ncbi:MAG: glycosyltransferase family 2 protein [Candidatus Levybacteria bacterium]|nr:glycosyltransferase family 2 protein [Candidatus Levybacteria bacterium]
MKVVIIIPTYNEKGNIEKLIASLEEEIFPQIKNHEMSILVADDNSPDGTAKEVTKLKKKFINLHLSSGERKGLGAAYIRAMDYAIKKLSADAMFEMDADLSHDPKRVPVFLKKFDGGFDMVVGTRYSEGGSIPPNWPFKRKMFSVVGNLLVRTILMRFGIHDWTGGFRVLKKDVFLKEKPELTNFKGYTFQVSFLHKAARDGFKIGEVPINFTDRTLGRSKIAPREYIIDLLTYVIVARIKEILFGKFGKFLIVGGTGFIINAVVLRVLVEWYKWNPSYANLAGAALAIFSNFNFNNLWTFRHRRIKSLGLYFWKMLHFYATSSFGVVFIQTGTIFVLSQILGKQGYFIYFLIGTFFLLIWNFTIYNRFIWKEKPL